PGTWGSDGCGRSCTGARACHSRSTPRSDLPVLPCGRPTDPRPPASARRSSRSLRSARRRGRGWLRRPGRGWALVVSVAARRNRQSIQRTDGALPVLLADVGVAQGGGQLVVPQQFLQAGQVGAVLEQVGGVAVPQRVPARLLADAGGADGPLAGALHVADAEVALGLAAGEQPGPGPMLTPVLPQQPQQDRRER